MAKKSTGLMKKGIVGGGILVVIIAIIFAVMSLVKTSDSLDGISETSVTEQGQVYIAVINMFKINAESDSLKGLADQRKAFAEKLNKEAKSREEKLMAAKKEIESKQSVLSKEALQQKAQAYQKNLMAYQKDMSEKSSAIEKVYREALQKVQEGTLDSVITDVAKKKNVTVVLNSSQAILLNPALDITADVISVLNRRLPKVHMDTPKGL